MNYLLVRLISSFLSGVILSQAGSFIQIGTRNVLASPSTLGIEGLSVLWLLLVHTIALGFGMNPGVLILSGTVVFAGIGLLLSRLTGEEVNLDRVLFLGLTFNLFVGAVFSLWQFFFLAFNLPFPMEMWFGHFRFVEEKSLLLLLGFELLLLWSLKRQWKNLTLYSLGNVISRAHGLNSKGLYAFFFIFSVCGTYLVISLFGAFSFLGLIFPLIARKLWFSRFDLKGEILLGSLVNGIFFLVTDFICYQFPIMGAEVPVGLIASLVGAVSLVMVLWNTRRPPDFLANARK